MNSPNLDAPDASHASLAPTGPGSAFIAKFCDIVTVPGAASVSGTVARSGRRLLDNEHTAVVIEDDADIRDLIATVLQQGGFEVHTAGTGADGVDLVRRHQPAITTVDVSMPGMDGFETTKRIRAISDTYVMMLTARAEEIDTLQGLQSGADDYLTKPFRPRELRARVEAMLRRPRQLAPPHQAGNPAEPGGTTTTAASRPARAEATALASAAEERNGLPGPDWIGYRGLAMHPQIRIVRVDEREVDLTRSEFDILHALLQAHHRVISKADLALVVRGEEYLGSTAYITDHDMRAIEVHIANLRRKLGDTPTRPRWIETVRGVGYRISPHRRSART